MRSLPKHAPVLTVSGNFGQHCLRATESTMNGIATEAGKDTSSRVLRLCGSAVPTPRLIQIVGPEGSDPGPHHEVLSVPPRGRKSNRELLARPDEGELCCMAVLAQAC
jgi:hypothetical protein